MSRVLWPLADKQGGKVEGERGFASAAFLADETNEHARSFFMERKMLERWFIGRKKYILKCCYVGIWQQSKIARKKETIKKFIRFAIKNNGIDIAGAMHDAEDNKVQIIVTRK